MSNTHAIIVASALAVAALAGCEVTSSDAALRGADGRDVHDDQRRLVLTFDAGNATTGRWSSDVALARLAGEGDGHGVEVLVEQARGGGSIVRLPAADFAGADPTVITSPAATLTLASDDGAGRAGTADLQPRPGFFGEFPDEPGPPPAEVGVLLELLAGGVDAEYVRAVASGQGDVTWAEVARLRRAGIDAAFVTRLSQARAAAEPRPGSPAEPISQGYSIDEIVRLGQYSVPLGFIDRWHASGYGRGVDELIRLKNYSLDPDAADRWNAVAGRQLSVDELIRVKNYSLDPAVAAAFRRVGYGFDIDRLIRLKNYSITPAYAEAMNAPGFALLSVDELIRLKNHNVDPSTLRALRQPEPGD